MQKVDRFMTNRVECHYERFCDLQIKFIQHLGKYSELLRIGSIAKLVAHVNPKIYSTTQHSYLWYITP